MAELQPPTADKNVCVVGCGSVGSTMAEMLVRSGVDRLSLVDPEPVGAENLSRTVYDADDLGTPKVTALTQHLRAINPHGRIDAVDGDVASLGLDGVDELISRSSLVVAATDDPAAQAVLNRFAFARGVPAIYPGIYARAKAGEVVIVIPGVTKCYRCVTSVRHGGREGARRDHDYGTNGRLASEIALGADIAHVTTAATKLALSLLAIEEVDHPLVATYLMPALTHSSGPRQLLIMSMVESWDFFPGVFDGVPGQGAYQAVWLSCEGDPECSVCGDERLDPLMTPLSRPLPEDIAELLDDPGVVGSDTGPTKKAAVGG